MIYCSYIGIDLCDSCRLDIAGWKGYYCYVRAYERTIKNTSDPVEFIKKEILATDNKYGNNAHYYLYHTIKHYYPNHLDTYNKYILLK